MVLPPPRSHVVEAGGLSLAPPSWAKLAVANRVSNVARTITFRIEFPGKSILRGIGRLAKIRRFHSSAQHNKAMMSIEAMFQRHGLKGRVSLRFDVQHLSSCLPPPSVQSSLPWFTRSPSV